MLCIYHKGDLDGKCSGAIIKLKFPNCECIGTDYGHDTPWEKMEQHKNDTIFLVDFSFPIEDMIKIKQSFKDNFIWIDHHKSAIEKSEENGYSDLNGKRFSKEEPRLTKAGCELTWTYVNGGVPPRAVSLLGRYDVWDHEIDKHILPFQYGMRAVNNRPIDKIWKELLEPDESGIYPEYKLNDIIEKGQAILSYERQLNEQVVKSTSFTVDFEHITFIAVVRSHSNSKIFDSVFNPETHQACMIISFGKNFCKVSMYCDPESDLDLSGIAVKYGGGGHKSACGFQTTDWDLIKSIMPKWGN